MSQPRIQPSEEIAYRIDFPLLCNARGYKDAVEVGTDLGVFARQFMSRFEGNWLYCVDPYEPHEEFPFDRDPDIATAVQALMPWHGRFRFVRVRSVAAARWIPTVISPEFVYVDGAHDEANVAADLDAWWPVLPPHGMLAGHDFDADHPGVMAAVSAFAATHGLTVYLTHERDSPPSWYCYKTEPHMLIHRFFRDGESPNDRGRGGR